MKSIVLLIKKDNMIIIVMNSYHNTISVETKLVINKRDNQNLIDN